MMWIHQNYVHDVLGICKTNVWVIMGKNVQISGYFVLKVRQLIFKSSSGCLGAEVHDFLAYVGKTHSQSIQWPQPLPMSTTYSLHSAHSWVKNGGDTQKPYLLLQEV